MIILDLKIYIPRIEKMCKFRRIQHIKYTSKSSIFKRKKDLMKRIALGLQETFEVNALKLYKSKIQEKG